jgi:ribonucleotide reductase beta subunit family protein with ferritin-like domain
MVIDIFTDKIQIFLVSLQIGSSLIFFEKERDVAWIKEFRQTVRQNSNFFDERI